jgi:hypothetical protein
MVVNAEDSNAVADIGGTLVSNKASEEVDEIGEAIVNPKGWKEVGGASCSHSDGMVPFS